MKAVQRAVGPVVMLCCLGWYGDRDRGGCDDVVLWCVGCGVVGEWYSDLTYSAVKQVQRVLSESTMQGTKLN